MPRRDSHLDPARLVEAAEAVMHAVAEVARTHRGKIIPPADLMGSPIQPACLCDFTKHEVGQATAFLVRLGFLPAAAGKQSK